eukprot:scaffold5730_cov55-Cyclotella_meneghiniana.AAC.17
MATFNDIGAICANSDNLSESELISILKATQIEPNLLSERDQRGLTLLHIAARYKRSAEFCSLIHEQNGTLVKTTDNHGMLPMYYACLVVNVETAKYLFNVYPESIKMSNRIKMSPVHFLAGNIKDSNDESLQLLAFLLKHDKGAVSTRNDFGFLPLHIACQKRELPFVKLLFDAHPEGIFVLDRSRDTPVDSAIQYRDGDGSDVVNFLETQIEFYRQSIEDQDPDINGQLPIHRVLPHMQSENVSLGTIKLMVGAHRASVTVADIQGCIPLHYACRFGHLDIVKYLVGLTADSPTSALDALDALDGEGNLPLHHACLGGKLDVVNYILDISPSGVSVQNNEGKLPICLLLFEAVCDRDLQYIDVVYSLLRANPIDSLAVISPAFFANEK